MKTASEQAPAARESLERSADSPLRAERERQGLSRKELAALAGTNANALTGIENGHHPPAVDVASRLAVALGVELESIFTLVECGCGQCGEKLIALPRSRSSARFLPGHNSRQPDHGASVTRGHQARRARLGIPEEKVCERCGRTFTRSEVRNQSDAHWLARKYCEGNCRWGVIKTEERDCAYCGKLIPRKVMAHNWRRRYCSRSHAQLARWKEGRVAAEVVEELPGGARRKWKLKWVPRPGRPRNDARLDYEDALHRIRDIYEETHASERDLERLLGESRRMIRTALGRPL
jgi:transcriptional regulator with XRE-family HTH domain